ncbi:MAG: magnesium transporter [Gammaproteobacteria bacterium]|nr:magnesium transporter [Gammaproteobacteria bacterium]
MNDPLALGYIEHHPAAAARTLARLDGDEVAALLPGLPPTLAAALLAYMTPALVARCFRQLPPPVSAEIVARMPSDAVINPLRLLDASSRGQLLGALPRTMAARLRFQLRYPQTLIGSLMEADRLTLTPELRVSDALRQVRQQRRPPGRQLYVVDDQQRLRGMVELGELLVARDRTPLHRLLQRPPLMLNALAALHTVSELEVWGRFDTLPVVSRGGEFQGVLSLSALQRGEGSDDSEMKAEQHMAQTRLALADLFWLVIGVLLPYGSGKRGSVRGGGDYE